MLKLSRKDALIFRITHIENVQWLLANGLHSSASGNVDPNFRQIGNLELINKRSSREVPTHPYGKLPDYVPFYFTPWSPMLYNIKTGYNEVEQIPMDDIVILVASLRDLANASVPFVFTDRHAYLKWAKFYDDLADLSHLDWKRLIARDFRRTNADELDKFERYQAEALVYNQLPITSLRAIVCHSAKARAVVKREAKHQSVAVNVTLDPSYFF